MKNLSTLILASAAILNSCGGSNKESSSPAPQVSDTPQISDTPQSNQDAPDLPEGAIIAVPVDGQGKELTNQADMRLLPQKPQSTVGPAIATSYQNGILPDHVSGELDQNTSTDSYRGWHNYRYFNSQGGRYNRFGYGNQGQEQAYCNYSSYQPTYYRSGVPYAWQYQSRYQTSSRNYYYYSRPRTQAPGNQQHGQGQQYPRYRPYSNQAGHRN